MFTSILRVVILYFIVLVALRLMGKRQIGEMQPFEFVITFMIADLATIPMAERTVPLLLGAVPVLTLLLIHFSISFLTRKSIKMRKVISGKPVIVVSPRGIEYDSLKRLNMTTNDLQEAIRNSGFSTYTEINYAIVETNGKVSIFPKAANNYATKEELEIKAEETELPVMLISEQKFIKENLNLLNISKEDTLKYVKEILGKKVTEKDLWLATLDINGNIFVQALKEDAVSGTVNFKGEMK